jgi:hypothetical protein
MIPTEYGGPFLVKVKPDGNIDWANNMSLNGNSGYQDICYSNNGSKVMLVVGDNNNAVAPYGVYLHTIDNVTGVVSSGIYLSTNTYISFMKVLPDGNVGYYVFWRGVETTDIVWCARINEVGIKQWGSNTQVFTSSNMRLRVVPGAIVRKGIDDNVYVAGCDVNTGLVQIQKILLDGSLPWGSDGITVPSSKYYCLFAEDAVGFVYNYSGTNGCGVAALPVIFTLTPTNTPSATNTQTISQTSTPSASFTTTPVTYTLSNTPTQIVTQTYSATITDTPINTPTATPAIIESTMDNDIDEDVVIYPNPVTCSGSKLGVKLEKPGLVKAWVLTQRGNRVKDFNRDCPHRGVARLDIDCQGLQGRKGIHFMLVEIIYHDGSKKRMKPVRFSVVE